MRRRVAITGIGVIAPGGVGTKSFWDLLVNGRTATRTISTFDPTPFRSRVAGEVDFDPASHGLTAEQVRRIDRSGQFAVVCAREAVTDSGLDMDSVDPSRVGPGPTGVAPQLQPVPLIVVAVSPAGTLSVTVTVNEQVAPVVEETFTVVTPTGNTLPDAGTPVTVPQPPDVTGAG